MPRGTPERKTRFNCETLYGLWGFLHTKYWFEIGKGFLKKKGKWKNNSTASDLVFQTDNKKNKKQKDQNGKWRLKKNEEITTTITMNWNACEVVIGGSLFFYVKKINWSKSKKGKKKKHKSINCWVFDLTAVKFVIVFSERWEEKKRRFWIFQISFAWYFSLKV